MSQSGLQAESTQASIQPLDPVPSVWATTTTSMPLPAGSFLDLVLGAVVSDLGSHSGPLGSKILGVLFIQAERLVQGVCATHCHASQGDRRPGSRTGNELVSLGSLPTTACLEGWDRKEGAEHNY